MDNCKLISTVQTNYFEIGNQDSSPSELLEGDDEWTKVGEAICSKLRHSYWNIKLYHITYNIVI